MAVARLFWGPPRPREVLDPLQSLRAALRGRRRLNDPAPRGLRLDPGRTLPVVVAVLTLAALGVSARGRLGYPAGRSSLPRAHMVLTDGPVHPTSTLRWRIM